jgi:ATP-dependent helicase/nuclease subunit B
VLSEHLAAERVRIEQGAPLPALGEGTVCEVCEARGLCRRDHWSLGDEADNGAR